MLFVQFARYISKLFYSLKIDFQKKYLPFYTEFANMDLLKLPAELIIHVLLILPFQDFISCTSVCMNLREVCKKVRFKNLKISPRSYADPAYMLPAVKEEFLLCFSQIASLFLDSCDLGQASVCNISFSTLRRVSFINCKGLSDEKLMSWIPGSKLTHFKIFYDQFDDGPEFEGLFLKYLPSTLKHLSLCDINIGETHYAGMRQMPLLENLESYETWGPFTQIPVSVMPKLTDVLINFPVIMESELCEAYMKYVPNIETLEWRFPPDDESTLSIQDVNNLFEQCRKLIFLNVEGHFDSGAVVNFQDFTNKILIL